MSISVFTSITKITPVNGESRRGMNWKTRKRDKSDKRGLITGKAGEHEKLKTCCYCGESLCGKPLSTHFNKKPSCLKRANGIAKAKLYERNGKNSNSNS